MMRRRMTTDKYGAIVGGTPPIQEDDDENNNHIMDNDADVEGLCFQCLHARHQCHAQAALLWLCNPTAVEGSDCFAMRMIRTKEGGEFNTMRMTMMTMTTTMTMPTTTMTATRDAQHYIK